MERWHEQMERYTVLLDTKNQYCENEYTTLNNLQIQWIPIKLPRIFTTGLEQKNFTKFAWKPKRPQIAKVIMRRKNEAGRRTLSDFILYILYYKAAIIKTVWYWQK